MDDPDPITFKEVETPEERRQVQAIRAQVFVGEQAIPAELDRDGLDVSSIHALGLYKALPVATGRLTIAPGRQGTLARIAVVPSYRGKGLGRRTVQYLESLARREGVAAVHLYAHDYLESFYRSLGYEKRPETTRAGRYLLIHMVKHL